MDWIIYHNESCSKSREALRILNEHQVFPTIIDYKTLKLDKNLILELISILKIEAKDIIRDNSQMSTAEEIAEAISENSLLLQRPIVIHKDKAIIARPPEKVLELF